MQSIFSQNPALAISAIFIFPLANMTVLVPVPEGNIKANEQAKVEGIVMSRESTPALTPIVAKIGRNMVAVAVLEFTSVMNTMPATTSTTIQNAGRPFKAVLFSPNHKASPVLLKPAPKASPPPRNIATPQGMRDADFQSIRRFPLPLRY